MTFRFATWNLQRPTALQGERRRRLSSWLGKVNADVWVLTETHSTVTPGEGFNVPATTSVDPIHEPGEAWATIWSRFPMCALPPSSDPTRAVAALIHPPGGRPIVVYGAVLPWVSSPWRDVPAAKGAAFAAALDVQSADWRALAAAHPDCDLVVAGDFNQDLAISHYYGSRVNHGALAAALARSGLTCLTAGVDDPVSLGGARSHATIDHLCVDASLAARARWPRLAWPLGPGPDKALSDHFGVAVDFGA